MEIGIIIHSHTGNTNLVAKKIREELEQKGHDVEYHRLKIAGGWYRGIREIRFESPPDAAACDALVLGSPVEGMALSPVMKTYLKSVGPLEGKRIALLVTQHFARPSLGGNRAVRQMEKACAGKGGAVCASAIVNWTNKRREQQIAEAVGRLSGAFGD